MEIMGLVVQIIEELCLVENRPKNIDVLLKKANSILIHVKYYLNKILQ